MEKNDEKNNNLISKCPLPKFINTLENFNIINYRGIFISRINLNSNFSQKKEKLDILSNELTKKSDESGKESDICILIKNEKEINDT